MKSKNYLDIITGELFDKHSLAALIILIDIGEELDFHYSGRQYAITCLNDKKLLSGPETEEVQEFKSITDLIINGKIENKIFINIWDDIILNFLY